jgi:anti-sigma B factor antagonist
MKRPPAVTILTGELDLHASRSLGDLTTVSFIDSAALGALVQADQRLGRQGRGMAVIAPDGSPAAELIELTHVSSQLNVHPTHEDAQAALEGEAAGAAPEPPAPS